MITGFATKTATAEAAKRHSHITFSPVGPRQLSVSQAGFGCYRVSAGVQSHADALRAALARGMSMLNFARAKGLGVLANRPLNALNGNRLVRLADMETAPRQPDDEIIRKIRAVIKSESQLWKRLLPACHFIPEGIRLRIQEQVAVGNSLKHYWKNWDVPFRQQSDSSHGKRYDNLQKNRRKELLK